MTTEEIKMTTEEIVMTTEVDTNVKPIKTAKKITGRAGRFTGTKYTIKSSVIGSTSGSTSTDEINKSFSGTKFIGNKQVQKQTQSQDSSKKIITPNYIKKNFITNEKKTQISDVKFNNTIKPNQIKYILKKPSSVVPYSLLGDVPKPNNKKFNPNNKNYYNESITLKSFMCDIEKKYAEVNLLNIDDKQKKFHMMEYVHKITTDNNLSIKYEKMLIDDSKKDIKLVHQYGNYEFLLQGIYDIRYICITNNSNMFYSPLAFEANGLIINTGNWKIVSIGTQNMCIGGNHNILKQYSEIVIPEVYSIIDGTTVSLYYNYDTSFGGNPRWCLSSGNSWYVNNYNWIGDETYEDIFNKLIYDNIVKKVPANITTKVPENISSIVENYIEQNFQKSKVYIFAFINPKFHPFSMTTGYTNRLIQLDEFDLETLTRVPMTLGKMGFQVQTPVDLTTREVNELMMDVEKPTNKFNKLKISELITDIIQNNSSSYDDFLEYDFTMNGEEAIKYYDFLVRFGYILKFKITPEQGTSDYIPPYYKTHNVVLMESQLMKSIRYSIYDLNNYKTKSIKVNNKTREDFIILKSYLNNKTRERFALLFKCYRDKIKNLQKIIGVVIDVVFEKLGGDKATITYNGIKNLIEEDKFKNIVDYFVKMINTTEFKNNKSLTTNDKSIVKDLIIDSSNLEVLFDLLS